MGSKISSAQKGDNGIPKIMKVATVCILINAVVISVANGETREECEASIPKVSNQAWSSGIGTASGTVVGVAACNAFLAAVFADLGLSFFTCVAAVAATGGLIGTTVGDTQNIEASKRCFAAEKRIANAQ